MTTRPKLLLDVSIMTGYYGGQNQLRPYAKTLLSFVLANFEVHWLNKVVNPTHLTHFIAAQGIDPEAIPTAMWSGELGTIDGIRRLCNFQGEWFVVSDSFPQGKGYDFLVANKPFQKRWIKLPNRGSDVLLDVKEMLDNWLSTGDMITPWPYQI